MKCYTCGGETERLENQVYSYVEGGLEDVQLVGVTVHRCRQCGEEMAELPALHQLHLVIGLLLTGKPSKLTGAELRFLRKELQINQKAFAKMLGYTPEHLSNVENGHRDVDSTADRLVRSIFRMAREKVIEEYRRLMEEVRPTPAAPDLEQFLKLFATISETPKKNPIQVNMADLVAYESLKRQEECPVA